MFDWIKKLFGAKPNSPYMTETQAPAPPPDQNALNAVLALGKPGIIYWETDAPSQTFTGGSPNLGSNYLWPEKNGVPLEFMGQVSLATVADLYPDSPLPKTGYLSFFYAYGEEQVWGFDPKDVGSWRVEYSEQGDPTPAPVEPFSQIFLRPELVTTYPGWESRLNRQTPNIDTLLPFWEELIPESNDASLQVCGFPCTIQNENMDEESAMVSAGIYMGNGNLYDTPEAISARATAEDWMLLAQFNSRESQEICFGDLGMIYYWIRKQDLVAQDFSKTWLILQCG